MPDIEIVGNEEVTEDSRLLPSFTKLETNLIEGTLEGRSVRQLSVQFQVPQVFIRSLLNKQKVKSYLKDIKEIVANSTQLKLQAVLSGVLEAQIESVDRLEELTNKDPLEVMRLLADISNQIVKGQEKAEETDKYANILSKIMKD